MGIIWEKVRKNPETTKNARKNNKKTGTGTKKHRKIWEKVRKKHGKNIK